MSKPFIVLTLLTLLTSACATSSNEEGISTDNTSNADMAATSTSETKQSGDDVICRTEQMSGSHFRRRICRTRDEIEQQRRDSQDFLGDRSIPISDSE